MLDSIPEGDRETGTVTVAPDECGIKTLGVAWNTGRDVFAFIVPDKLIAHVPAAGNTITRRQLLAMIATVFDPLGWIAPLTVKMKILFQWS